MEGGFGGNIPWSGEAKCGKWVMNQGLHCKNCSAKLQDHQSGIVSESEIVSYLNLFEKRNGSSVVFEDPSGSLLYLGRKETSTMPYIQFRAIQVVVNASILHRSRKPKLIKWAKEVEVIEARGCIRVLRLDWDDEPHQELSRLREAILFLHEALRAGRNALIHCGQGKSRSGALLVAFLMARLALPYDEALAQARSRRPIIKPNAGFEDQLRKFETSQQLASLRLLLQ